MFFQNNPRNNAASLNRSTTEHSTEDKSIQVNTLEDFKSWKIDEFIDCDSKCNVLTGVVNLTILNSLVNALSQIDTSKTHLNCKQKTLLTLMRLKLDLSFACLAILFQISSKSASMYFNSTVQHLGMILTPLIRFPSKEEVVNNLPTCFKKYRSTRIVLDCTEIYIEKSKCLNCRIRTYSNYKGRHMH